MLSDDNCFRVLQYGEIFETAFTRAVYVLFVYGIGEPYMGVVIRYDEGENGKTHYVGMRFFDGLFPPIHAFDERGVFSEHFYQKI